MVMGSTPIRPVHSIIVSEGVTRTTVIHATTTRDRDGQP